MKKIFSLLLIIASFVTIIPKDAFASDTGYFIVTAYYSPLPDQKHYITGNYELEKRLNGNGIAGASGRKVFSGMLAAPSKYSFGTKIQLDGLGIGSVEDRGGAIVPAGMRGYSHDRIDIWVGYGDEGLRRAMYWGKRKVAGRVVSSGSKVNLDYAEIPAPSWAVPQTTTLYGKKVQVAQDNSPQVGDAFSISLGKGSNAIYIKKLQDILKEVGYYYEEELSGEYDTQTIDAVYNFQINYDIVSNESTPGAGSYGPKTRKKLQEVYNLHLEEVAKEKEYQESIEILKQESNQSAQKHIDSIGKPTYGEISPRVRELQKTLITLGYFEYKDTAIFGVKTRNSLLEFQSKNEIIKSENEIGAGTFGPKTREVIVKELSQIHFMELLEQKGYLEKYLENTQQEDTLQDISLIAKTI